MAVSDSVEQSQEPLVIFAQWFRYMCLPVIIVRAKCGLMSKPSEKTEKKNKKAAKEFFCCPAEWHDASARTENCMCW